MKFGAAPSMGCADAVFSLKKIFQSRRENGIKKHTYANKRQSQRIRIRLQSESTGLDEQLPVLLFQRSTMQTKSMQEEVQVN